MSLSNGPSMTLGVKGHVLYSQLLKEDEYWALLQLKSTEEIAAFLKQTIGYKDQLETLLPAKVHRIDLENSVRASVLTEANSFLFYLRGVHRKVFLDWLSWYESGQIKSLFRWLHSKRQDRDTMKQYLFHVPSSKLPYEALLSCHNYNDILEALHDTRYYNILNNPVKRLAKGEKSLFALEMAIDNMVETNLYNDITQLPSQERDLLKPIFGTRADLLNLYHLHRCLWYYNMSTEEAVSHMLPVIYKVTRHKLREIAQVPTITERLDLMEDLFPTYGKLFKDALEKDDAELALETSLRRFTYKKALSILRSGTPGFHTAIAYFILKDNEVADIIRIIEDVRYDYDRSLAIRYLTKPITNGGEHAWQ